MNTYRFSIDVPVENRWDNVERVRIAVQSCFEAVFQDVTGRDALAMVTGELVENAIKYGDWTTGRGLFRLRVWGDDTKSAVAVTNPVALDGAGPTRVQEAIGFIASHESPLHAYQARMVEIAGGAPSDGGLGLLRIAYEGMCTITVVNDAEGITVTATRQNAESHVQAPLSPS